MSDETTPILTRKVFDSVETHFVPGERSMVAWISTDSKDHERDVVVASGVDFKTYFLGKTPEEGNPCVLALHDLGKWPLGQCKWIKVKQGRGFTGLYAMTVFDDDEDAEKVWRKIKSGTLKGISIGFRPPDDLKPGEWGPPTREELLRRPDWKGAERIIRRCVLLEYSVCSIGMNPQALVAAVNKGLHKPNYSLSSRKNMVQPAFDLISKDANAKGIASADVTPADARIMIGLAIPPDVATSLAVVGGEPPEEMHVTLCYLGRAIEVGTRALDRVKELCREIASWGPNLKGQISGVGRFSASTTSDGKDVVYASADIPDLPEFRQRLAEGVQGQGVQYSRAHGYTPHVTLAYVDPDAETPVPRIAPIPVEFESLSLWVDGVRTDYPFNVSGIAYGGPFMAWRSANSIETKDMNDDELDEDKAKPCECGKADCKCSEVAKDIEEEPTADEVEPDAKDMAEASGESGGSTVEPEGEAEEEEDDDEPEEIGPLKRYDHASIKSPHYKGFGRVESLHTKGHVPHASNHMMGSKEDPAACIKCYRKIGDGYTPTDDHIAVKVAHLTKLGTPMNPPSKKSAPAPVAKTVRTEPLVEPLPTVVVKSDQEVRAELIAKLNEMLSPEGFRRIAREEAERAAGFV